VAPANRETVPDGFIEVILIDSGILRTFYERCVSY